VTLRHTPYCLYVTVASDDHVDFLSPSVSDAIATETEIKQMNQECKHYHIIREECTL